MAQSGSAPIVNHKPKDDAFHQQRLKTWQPILSPMNVIIIFTAVGVAFVSIGIGLMSISNNIYEQTFVYDSPTLPKTPACTDIAKCGCQRTAEYPTGHSCPGVSLIAPTFLFLVFSSLLSGVTAFSIIIKLNLTIPLLLFNHIFSILCHIGGFHSNRRLGWTTICLLRSR